MFFMEQMKTLTRPFENRSEVGRLLAAQLEKYAGEPNLLVLALPRDGDEQPRRSQRRPTGARTP